MTNVIGTIKSHDNTYAVINALILTRDTPQDVTCYSPKSIVLFTYGQQNVLRFIFKTKKEINQLV